MNGEYSMFAGGDFDVADLRQTQVIQGSWALGHPA